MAAKDNGCHPFGILANCATSKRVNKGSQSIGGSLTYVCRRGGSSTGFHSDNDDLRRTMQFPNTLRIIVCRLADEVLHPISPIHAVYGLRREPASIVIRLMGTLEYGVRTILRIVDGYACKSIFCFPDDHAGDP